MSELKSELGFYMSRGCWFVYSSSSSSSAVCTYVSQNGLEKECTVNQLTSSWKALPSVVGLIMPMRIAKSPKRSPSLRSAA
jgi:hypothetical protein